MSNQPKTTMVWVSRIDVLDGAWRTVMVCTGQTADHYVARDDARRQAAYYVGPDGPCYQRARARMRLLCAACEDGVVHQRRGGSKPCGACAKTKANGIDFVQVERGA